MATLKIATLDYVSWHIKIHIDGKRKLKQSEKKWNFGEVLAKSAVADRSLWSYGKQLKLSFEY